MSEQAEQTNNIDNASQSDAQGNLFVGQIEEAYGFIKTDEHGDEEKGHSALFWGSVVLRLNLEGGYRVQGIERISLYGRLEKPDLDERIGTFSLASSLPAIEKQDQELLLKQSINDIQMQLHYRALTEELEPLYEEEDVLVPSVELLAVNASWTEIDPLTKTDVTMTYNFTASNLIDAKLGVIQGITLNEPITFQQVGNSEPPSEPKNTLTSHCAPPPAASCPDIYVRSLKLKFINFSKKYDLAKLADKKALEALCNSQLSAACEIWRKKSALQLWPLTQIVHPSPQPDGSTPLKNRFFKANRGDRGAMNRYFASTTRIEIYLIDELINFNGEGGGTTINVNQASAYCILEVGSMENNSQLLAHELCHVMGLGHPDGSFGIPSSFNSIAEPSTPNSTDQTWFNLRIFTDSSIPLNPKVTPTSWSACYSPDRDM